MRGFTPPTHLPAMNTGVCVIRLRLPENGSLKGKRRIVKSLMARARNKFNISIAEVDDLELWQAATIGFSCVGNDAAFVNDVLYRVLSFIEATAQDSEVTDYRTELLEVF